MCAGAMWGVHVYRWPMLCDVDNSRHFLQPFTFSEIKTKTFCLSFLLHLPTIYAPDHITLAKGLNVVLRIVGFLLLWVPPPLKEFEQ